MKPLKELEIVVGIVERDNKILLLQRKDENSLWDKKWEFPGGKIDHNEDPKTAVVREVLEETGMTVRSLSFLGMHNHDWDLSDKILRVHMHCFHCHVGEGDVVHEERTAYRTEWTTAENALSYDSLEANAAMLRILFLCQNTEPGLK